MLGRVLGESNEIGSDSRRHIDSLREDTGSVTEKGSLLRYVPISGRKFQITVGDSFIAASIGETCMRNSGSDLRKSAFGLAAAGANPLSLGSCDTGQGARSAARAGGRSLPATAAADPLGGLPLGEPLDIRQVARLIGCSVWSVRQRHVPNGLPHLRSSPSGKLIFYRDQVVAWILENQIREGNR